MQIIFRKKKNWFSNFCTLGMFSQILDHILEYEREVENETVK